jgi:hypothetical protein
VIDHKMDNLDNFIHIKAGDLFKSALFRHYILTVYRFISVTDIIFFRVD